MSEIEPDNRLLRSIPLDDVADYLLEGGWRRVEHPNNKLLVFEGPDDDDGKPIRLILPRRMDYQDSDVRLAEAINLIAAVEERSPTTLANELALNAESVRNLRRQHTGRIRTEIAVLEHSLEQVKRDMSISSLLFHMQARDWHPEYAELSPVSIPGQTHLARLCLYSAIGAVITGAVLAGTISSIMGLPLWIGPLLSVLTTLMFQGTISTVFGAMDSPHDMLRRVQRRILAPSFVLSILSLTTFMLARLGSSGLLLTASILTTTVALPALAAGLFTFWSSLSWSERAERKYAYLKQQESELRAKRDELVGELDSIQSVAQLSIDRPLKKSFDISREISP